MTQRIHKRLIQKMMELKYRQKVWVRFCKNGFYKPVFAALRRGKQSAVSSLNKPHIAQIRLR
jgi:hypothetical protein